MIKGVIFFAISFLVPFSWSVVQAHQVQSDNGISVLLHVHPNDKPYSGTTTSLYLTVSDPEKRFSGEQCDCIVSVAPYASLADIKNVGTHISFDSPLMKHEYGNTYVFSHLFPRSDVYAVVLEGTPIEPGAFKPFSVVFNLRVEKGETVTVEEEQESLPVYPLLSPVLLLVVGLCGAGGIFTGIWWFKRGRYR